MLRFEYSINDVSREDGGFCDPNVYLDALTWGPTNEIIALINQDTKIIDAILAQPGYKGSIEGTFAGYNPDTEEWDAQLNIKIKLRERLEVAGQVLDQYTDAASQDSATNSWVNHKVVTNFYRFVRQNYFGAQPEDHQDPEFNCVQEGLCQVIYPGQGGGGGAQDTIVFLLDSGFALFFTPEGQIDLIYLLPVRFNPFESNAAFSMAPVDAPGMLNPTLSSDACSVSLNNQPTWANVQAKRTIEIYGIHCRCK